MKKLFIVYVILSALLVVRFDEEKLPFYCSVASVELEDSMEEGK